MQSRVTVHVLEFYGCFNTHVEIVLKEERDAGTFYYNMNQWERPKAEAVKNEKNCLECLDEADKIVTFDLENIELNSIIQQWKNKYEDDAACMCSGNCADATAWFLENFADIPNPGNCGRPVTCDYLCCGFFAPSFLQCCTIPGRVVSYTQIEIAKKATQSEEAVSLLDGDQPTQVKMGQ